MVKFEVAVVVELDDQAVRAGKNTDEVPWVEVEEDAIRGNLGCNFGGGDFDATGVFVKASWGSELAACISADPTNDLMWTEKSLVDLLRGADGFELIVSGDSMTWRTSDHEAIFESADR